ncbi:MAG: RsmB/NOP family class I SAM-dependent RNA methyltransferase [Oscillospiraceae bacterium]|nr:RsmB/NOP family class I SAM-dependent RNA methyltransferase [Oscillospiraceae bacterium]
MKENNFFEKRCERLLGKEWRSLFTVPKNMPFKGLTVNRLRCTPQKFLDNAPFLIERNNFADESFTICEENLRAGTHVLHHSGVYYIQEPSASSAAAVLRVQPGDRVLDVCAAPGGKSAQLAAALMGQGVLFSNEYIKQRAQILLSNTERMGAENVVVLNEDTARIAKALPGYFTKILVDAPCSGEGMFRKEPQALAQHCQSLVEQCAAMQKEILDNAALCLADGGELVYSTCTFSPEENEGNIGAFLQRHPEFSLLDCDVTFGCAGHKSCCINGEIDTEKVRRIYPCHGGEGHFVARLKKAGQADTGRSAYKALKETPPPKEYLQFVKKYFPPLQNRKTACVNGAVYILPQEPLPDLKRLNVLRAGVCAGTVEKNRFEPHHHLFSVYGGICANIEHLKTDEPRTAAFLRGEEIEAQTAQDGFAAVVVEDFPLSFGKVSAGRLKNRYPKGLRNLK